MKTESPEKTIEGKYAIQAAIKSGELWFRREFADPYCLERNQDGVLVGVEKLRESPIIIEILTVYQNEKKYHFVPYVWDLFTPEEQRFFVLQQIRYILFQNTDPNLTEKFQTEKIIPAFNLNASCLTEEFVEELEKIVAEFHQFLYPETTAKERIFPWFILEILEEENLQFLHLPLLEKISNLHIGLEIDDFPMKYGFWNYILLRIAKVEDFPLAKGVKLDWKFLKSSISAEIITLFIRSLISKKFHLVLEGGPDKERWGMYEKYFGIFGMVEGLLQKYKEVYVQMFCPVGSENAQIIENSNFPKEK